MSIEILTDEPVNPSIPHISLHHVTRFVRITAAHFDQMYNKYSMSFTLLTPFASRPSTPRKNINATTYQISQLNHEYVHLHHHAI